MPRERTRISARACVAARRFGLTLDERADRRAPASPGARAAIRAIASLPPGSVALVSGPNGAGKTTLLRAIVRAARAKGRPVIRVSDGPLPRIPALDAVAEALGFTPGDGADEAMRWLIRAGLGEARLMIRSGTRMSEGERARLRLALAFARAHRARKQGNRRRSGGASGATSGGAPMVVVDEFLAALDRPCAAGVARGGASLARVSGATLLGATSHDDLARPLAPTIEARLTLAGAIALRAPLRRTPRVRISPGTYEDYGALAPFHYRAARPATIVRILTARIPGVDGPAGALVVSMPARRGAWRELAWPGRYRTWQTGADRSGATRRLNAEVRCLSRIIVDPRCRSMGVAMRLVRAYLRSPLTVHTESVAAMGGLTSFLDRAGMTRYALPPRPSEARLLDALDHCAVDESLLAASARAWRRAHRSNRRLLARELRRWAAASGVTRRFQRAPARAIFDHACRKLRAETTAYAAASA